MNPISFILLAVPAIVLGAILGYSVVGAWINLVLWLGERERRKEVEAFWKGYGGVIRVSGEAVAKERETENERSAAPGKRNKTGAARSVITTADI